MANSLRESLLGRHASCDAVVEGPQRQATQEQPFAERLLHAVNRDHAPCGRVLLGLALVVVLLGGCRPSAILDAVIPLVVDAVDAVVLRGSPAHVGQEVLEDVPPLADRDTTRPVVGVVTVVWVFASTEHCGPGAIFRSLVPISALPVPAARFAQLYSQLSAKAPTGIGHTSPEYIAGDQALLAAVAATPPSRLSFAAALSLCHEQSPESLACQVYRQHVVPPGVHGAPLLIAAIMAQSAIVV